MSANIQKLEPIQIKPSASPKEVAIASLIPKQLPDSIINRISSFTSYNELLHTIHPVRKTCRQLPINGILNLNNSLITDKELIKIIDKEQVALTCVNLSNCSNITDLSLKYLSKLRNLRTLNLSGCYKITDAGVKDLSKLQNLRTLNLRGCGGLITDAGAKDLSKMQNLTTLDLGDCNKITDAGVKDLSKMQNLTTLDLSYCREITDAGVKDLAKLQNLTTLNLRLCNKITDVGAKDLAKLQNLTTLDLRSCDKITDAGARDLSKLQNLTTLDLRFCNKITDIGVKDLAKLQNLTTLNLSWCDKITDAGVKDLSKLLNLTTVDLVWCKEITDAGAKDLSKLPNLTTLNLSQCNKITDIGVKDLSKLQNLTTLNLSQCNKITDIGVKDLAKLQNLTTLDLSQCNILTDICANDLVKLQNLTTLNLNSCYQITDAGIEDLVKLQKLTKLDLCGVAGISSPIYDKKLNIARQMIAEKTVIKEFLNEKSQKNRILKCEPHFKDEHEMSCTALLAGFQININSLYLLAEKNMDSFLLQNPDVQKSVKTFLVQKTPELIETAAKDLIKWFNSNAIYKVAINDSNKLLAKELLIMHAIGKLSAMKRFLLSHEMGHAHDHDGRKSLGDFDPLKLDFIMLHQFSEVRADLTAAREENAHELAIAYFEWRNIISGEQDGLGSHPTDLNRAKAIEIDLNKIQI